MSHYKTMHSQTEFIYLVILVVDVLCGTKFISILLIVLSSIYITRDFVQNYLKFHDFKTSHITDYFYHNFIFTYCFNVILVRDKPLILCFNIYQIPDFILSTLIIFQFLCVCKTALNFKFVLYVLYNLYLSCYESYFNSRNIKHYPILLPTNIYLYRIWDSRHLCSEMYRFL